MTAFSTLSPPRSGWQTDAACHGVPTAWFFSPNPSSRPAQRAFAACASCPVASDCRADAEGDPARVGIWGGRYFPVRSVSAQYQAECAQCGEPFWTNRTTRLYCSRNCKWTAQYLAKERQQ